MAIKSGGKERTGGKGSVFLFSGRYAFGVEKGCLRHQKAPRFQGAFGLFLLLEKKNYLFS